jgi:8-oxo-dGTP pyrophosphatase MutT (NUDIX family)
MVPGGCPACRTTAETVAAEAWEEVGLDAESLEHLTAIDEMALTYVTEKGLHRELLVVF